MIDILLILLLIAIFFPAFGFVAVGVSIAWVLKVILLILLIGLVVNLFSGRRWW